MEPKKPPRDLSDLKARLGLVKPSGAPPAPMPSPIAPIPGPASVPAGPTTGAHAPVAAPAPKPPDPRRDPFAHVAPRTGGHPAMITDAGPPIAVPDVPKARGLGLTVIVAAVVAVFGFYAGLVYRSRVLYNMSIDDATQIKEEVESIKKKSASVYTKIFESHRRSGGDVDLQLIDDLQKLVPLTAPKTDKLFRTNYALLENLTIDRLFKYYNDTIRMYDLIEKFVRDWGKDEARKELQKAVDKRVDRQTNYGIVIDTGGDIPIGMLVEVGAPVCKNPQEKECPASQIASFDIRADVTGRWTPRKVRGNDGERVIPIKPDTSLADKVLAGGIEQVAARQFRLQLAEIIQLGHKVSSVEKDLVEDLAKASAQSKVFTF